MITIGLATFALTYILRYTDGPGNICLLFRQYAGIEYLEEVHIGKDELTIVEYIPDRFIPKLVGCFWCLGTWIALIALIINNSLPIIIAWFAIVGVAGAIHEMIHGASD